MVTPLTPTGAPRSNAMSTDAGSSDFTLTARGADARSPRPLYSTGRVTLRSRA